MTAQTRSRASRRLGWLVVLGLALTAIAAPSGSVVAAQDTVDICHSTGSDGNPYVVNHPAKDGDVSGHADHTGPIWFDGIEVEWGDIIPPFTFEGGSFPGLNWTTEGQAIYDNDCNIVEATATPTQAPTATPTEAPTGTPTGSVEPTQTVNPTDPPTEAPTGTVAGATATPARTLPSTSTIDGSGEGPMNDGWRIVLLALAGVLAAALLLTPATAVVRKDDRRS
jgi:hypothetical protein